MVADGADVGTGALGSMQADAALAAGKLHGLVLLGHGVDGLVTNGAPGLVAFALVKDHRIAAVGAQTAGQLVRADINRMTAGAVDFLSCEEACLGFSIPSAGRAFNNEFRHHRSFFPTIYLCINYRKHYTMAYLLQNLQHMLIVISDNQSLLNLYRALGDDLHTGIFHCLHHQTHHLLLQ